MDIAANAGITLRYDVGSKRKRDPFDFRFVVAPIGQFQTMVATINGLLTDVHFFVIKTKDFEGVKVDAQTTDGSTALKQTLTCSVELPDGVEEVTFCVNVSELYTRIKNGNATALEIIRYTGMDKLTITYPNARPRREFTLRTLTKTLEDNRMFDIDTDITVQSNLAEFKEITRDFQKWGGEVVGISIRTTPEDVDPTKHSFLLLTSVSEAGTSTVTYHSNYQVTDSGEFQVLTDKSSSENYDKALKKSVVKFSEEFNILMINNFLKGIDKGKIWLGLNANGPLIIEYSLGNENSKMRLILAPKDDDDE